MQFSKKCKTFSDIEFRRLITRIKDAEGFSPHPYFDRTQYTWGFGTKAPKSHGTINEFNAHLDLVSHLKKVIKQYNSLFKNVPFPINTVRREALCDMIYNLGFYGFKRFKKMLKLIFNDNPNDWDEIADQSAHSKWYKQVGKRSEQIYIELLNGNPVRMLFHIIGKHNEL